MFSGDIMFQTGKCTHVFPFQEVRHWLRLHGTRCEIQRGVYIISLHAPRMEKSGNCQVHVVSPDSGRNFIVTHPMILA